MPRAFTGDPALLGRRIQQQNATRPPVVYVAPPVPPTPAPRSVTPSYRPIVVPSPDELGIRLDPVDPVVSAEPSGFKVPPPEQVGVRLD